jgi:hypothetical protein
MVLEQHFEGAESEGFVEHFLDEAVALAAVEEMILGIAEVLDDETDFAAEYVALQLADAGEVKLVHELGVDAALEALEVAALVFVARARRWCFCRGHNVDSFCEGGTPWDAGTLLAVSRRG